MFIHNKLAVMMVMLMLHGHIHAFRIVGGHEAKPHSRPYMVLLERKMENGATLYCAGFLLNEDFVMTAAHCKAKVYTVKLGLHNVFDINEKVQNTTVEQTFPHQHYKSKTLENDIMLLKLRSKVKFNNYVQPIGLGEPTSGSLPTSCSVSGWGQTSWTDKYMHDSLMEINVTLINNKMCEDDNMYCSDGEIGPGEGDSGGPLVCKVNGKDQAYGVMSTIVIQSSVKTYLYPKLTSKTYWILSTIEKAQRKN